MKGSFRDLRHNKAAAGDQSVRDFLPELSSPGFQMKVKNTSHSSGEVLNILTTHSYRSLHMQ